MAGEVDVIAGVAQGAAAGAAFGPVGAVIGGAIGLAGGLISGGAKKKARRAQRRANALRQETARLRSFAEQRNLLRQAQVAQAQGLATAAQSGADVASSGAQGVKASVYTQMIDSFLLGEDLFGTQVAANKQDMNVGKYLERADTVSGIMAAGAKLATLIPHGGSTASVGTPNQTSYSAPNPQYGEYQYLADAGAFGNGGN